jgi:hypothetical protein
MLQSELRCQIRFSSGQEVRDRNIRLEAPMKRNHWVRQGVVLAPGGGAPPAPRKPTHPARETLARSVCQGLLLRKQVCHTV